MRSAFGTAVLLALMTVCVIVGYNIIGPIVTRVNQEKIEPTTTPEPYFSDSSEVTLEHTPAVSEQQTTVLTTVTTAEITTVATTTTEPVMTRYPEGVDAAYMLPEDALRDLNTLDRNAEDAAKQGYTSVILPLKLKGGMLQYASANERARTSGASNDRMLTLREITNAAERYHLQCAALFSTLEDHVYPNVYMDGSYTFNGSTRWLDNKPEQGGKPWLNPFDSASGTYLANLAAELTQNGMTHILCTDAVFPNFFRSDAELLGNRIQDPEQRKAALASVLNQITDAAPCAGSYISLAELVLGHEEAFVPDQLSMKQFYVRIDPLDLPQAFTLNGQHFDPTPLADTDKLLLLASAAQQAIGDRTLIPVISVSGKSDAEAEQMITALCGAGYKTICADPGKPAATENEGEPDAAEQ